MSRAPAWLGQMGTRPVDKGTIPPIACASSHFLNGIKQDRLVSSQALYLSSPCARLDPAQRQAQGEPAHPPAGAVAVPTPRPAAGHEAHP